MSWYTVYSGVLVGADLPGQWCEGKGRQLEQGGEQRGSPAWVWYQWCCMGSH